jgi:hypothetical protein
LDETILLASNEVNRFHTQVCLRASMRQVVACRGEGAVVKMTHVIT